MRTDPPRLGRPYTVVGGRTAPARPLAPEAVVRSLGAASTAADVSPERQRIRVLATQPMSVAELAAHLHLPLGVVRVLVADLLADGEVVVSATVDDRPDAVLLERVLDGLRSL